VGAGRPVSMVLTSYIPYWASSVPSIADGTRLC
jgi:hypothetical protein